MKISFKDIYIENIYLHIRMDGFMGEESMGRGGGIIGMKVSRIWKARGFIHRKREDS